VRKWSGSYNDSLIALSHLYVNASITWIFSMNRRTIAGSIALCCGYENKKKFFGFVLFGVLKIVLFWGRSGINLVKDVKLSSKIPGFHKFYSKFPWARFLGCTLGYTKDIPWVHSRKRTLNFHNFSWIFPEYSKILIEFLEIPSKSAEFSRFSWIFFKISNLWK